MSVVASYGTYSLADTGVVKKLCAEAEGDMYRNKKSGKNEGNVLDGRVEAELMSGKLKSGLMTY